MEKLITTLITVVVAVGASAAIWVGANLLFSQVRNRWARFSAIASAAIAFVLGLLLSGNRVLIYSDGADSGLGQFAQLMWFPLLAAVVAAAAGLLLSRVDAPAKRLALGVGAGAGLGLLAGALVRPEYYPTVEPVALLAYTVVVAGIGAGIGVLRGNSPVNGALYGAALGWILGAWGAATIGEGNVVWAVIAMAVPPALVGARIGLGENPPIVQRAIIDQKSRAAIFLGPALLFIFISLVVPTIRTLYLSFLDRRSEEFVGLGNYIETFQQRGSLDLSGFPNLFGSRLFWIAVILGIITVIVGRRQKRETGHFVELGSPTMGPLLGAGILFSFALFTALRGTIINNLWWVVVVVFFSTSLGLAVAVLADNVRGEKIAKSLIFMPMAISLVGASIIWRFMYQARDVSIDQTGVLNALWVGLGRLSTGNGPATYIVGAIALLTTVGLLAWAARGLVRKEYGAASVPGLLGLLIGWFTIRFFTPGGVGGVILQEDGTYVANTVLFVQDAPYNNFWLMIVLVWIQTGFSMVILSAAIRAVPEDTLEAARVDGATASQSFWRVTLPQIGSTIGVLVTTQIVLVMKVFDIVKVMTNGQFGTQVLANDMFNTAFTQFNTGRGAALAILILVSVLPVMYYNVRQMQQEV